MEGETAMNITNHTQKPYFERLPRYALPGLQAAWDKAKAKSFGTLAIYTSFCRDMDEVGVEKPSKPIMTDWISQIQMGLVGRPGARDEFTELAESFEEDTKAETASESVVAKAPDPVVAMAAPAKPFFTPEFPADQAPIEPMTDALRLVSTKMLDELVAEFEANARRHATALVVGILRDLAVEMERAA
jgi:hypothetical protein